MHPANPLPLRLFLGLAIFLGCQSSVVWAQKAPGVGYAYPPGGRAGSTVEVKLGGYDWTPDMQFLVHDAAVKLEVLSAPSDVIPHLPPYWFGIKSMVNDPPLPREVTARLTLPADLPEGPLRWCVANANGGSPSAVFIVGRDPEVLEDEQRATPQVLPELPVTVNGRLLRIEEVDRYQFQTASSGLVTIDLMARRLGSDFLGVLEVRDADGRKIAETFDTAGHDPELTVAVEGGKPYVVAVRDLDYRGYRSLTYRLKLTTGPRVTATIPAAGRRGETCPVEFIGYGLVTGKPELERLTREVSFPADPATNSVPYRLSTPAVDAALFSLPLSDVPEQVRLDSTAPAAMPLSVPTAITGRIQSRAPHTYLITGKTGDVLNLAAEATRSPSSLDLLLTVTGPDGKELASKDDSPGSTDPRLTVTLPADGDYQISVADVSGLPHQLDSIYRLIVEPAKPRFSLATTGVLNLPVASPTANLEGTVVREGGFKEPIKLTVSGLPIGVTAPTDVVIEPAATAFKIPLKIDPNSPAEASFVQITGTAEINGQPITVQALAPATGLLAGRDPESNFVPRILVTTTLKPPFKIKPTEADGGRRVHRGATHLAELLIERDAGFDGEILLDMSATQSRHRQGIFGPQMKIAPTVRSIEYPVFVPECLETARTSRIGLVGMTKVRDPKGTERTVLALVEGQITMSIEGALLKLSHAAEELVVPVGQSFVVPLKLARSRNLTGDVSIELKLTDKQAGSVEASPVVLAADQDAINWTISVKGDSRLLGPTILTARATTLRDGFPVVSECEIPVEFVSAAVTSSTR